MLPGYITRSRYYAVEPSRVAQDPLFFIILDCNQLQETQGSQRVYQPINTVISEVYWTILIRSIGSTFADLLKSDHEPVTRLVSLDV